MTIINKLTNHNSNANFTPNHDANGDAGQTVNMILVCAETTKF